jgi:hypothetical protein
MNNLKDILVMEVPSGVLKETIKRENLNAKLSVIEEMAEEISSKSPSTAEQLVDQFRFAGATAVNLHVIINGISSEWYNIEYFKNHLMRKYGRDIFYSGLRPQPSDEPKLIKAFEMENKLVLAFTLLGSARRFYENYEIVVRRPQILEYVIIHFSPFAIEIRSSQTRNEIFKKAVLEIMDVNNEVAWDKLTKLNDEQAIKLAELLSARLRKAKHKMTEGVYDTKEVTAKPKVNDLAATKEYQAEFSGKPMRMQTLVFDYTYSFGYKQEVSYVITTDGLWFRTQVGEEVIEYVLDKIIRIKYPVENNEELDIDDEEYVEETTL